MEPLSGANRRIGLDVIMEYAFGQSSRKLEAPDFDDDFHEACINGGRQLFLTRHFPILLRLIKVVPPGVMLKCNPAMASFFAMHRDIGAQARALYDREPVATNMPLYLLCYSSREEKRKESI